MTADSGPSAGGGSRQAGGDKRGFASVTRDGSRTSHYDFELPVDRIAQFPSERRGESRLMVVNRSTGAIAHKQFGELAQLIPAGDALVVNTTRVFRARLLGVRDN